MIRRLQSKLRCCHLHIGRPIGTDFNVSQVTRVKPLGVFRSMLLCLWIEMLASGLEVGLGAISFFMDMNSVRTGRQLRSD